MASILFHSNYKQRVTSTVARENLHTTYHKDVQHASDSLSLVHNVITMKIVFVIPFKNIPLE